MGKMRQLKRSLQHIRLLWKPAAMAVLAVGAWHLFRSRGWQVAGDSILTDAFLPGVFGLHAIVSGFVVGWGLKRMSQAHDCRADSAKLDHLLALRIPGVIHLLLGTASGLLFLGFALFPYSNRGTGVFLVAAVTFVLGVYWEVAMELDDPEHGVWKIERPEEEETSRAA